MSYVNIHPGTHSYKGTKTPRTLDVLADSCQQASITSPHSHGRPTKTGTETAGGRLCLGPTARLLLSKANTATATTEHLPITSLYAHPGL